MPRPASSHPRPTPRARLPLARPRSRHNAPATAAWSPRAPPPAAATTGTPRPHRRPQPPARRSPDRSAARCSPRRRTRHAPPDPARGPFRPSPPCRCRTTAAPTPAPTHTSSRPRSTPPPHARRTAAPTAGSRRLQQELVPHTPDRPDDVRVTGIVTQMLPQAPDVHIDHPLIPVEVIPPDPLQELPPGKDPPGRIRECGQQVKFQGRQHHRPTCDSHLTAIHIQRQTREDAAPLLGRRCSGPSQHRLDPRRDLPRAERFGDVVIGSNGQTDELVHLLGPSGDQHEIHVGKRPQPPQHLHGVHVGQHHIQQHHVRGQLTDLRQRGGAGARLAHPEPLGLQITAQNPPDLRLVIDHQYLTHSPALLRTTTPGAATAPAEGRTAPRADKPCSAWLPATADHFVP